MSKVDVALVSCRSMVGFDIETPTVLARLEERGARVELCCWDDPSVDWESMPLAVIRSTWDYIVHLEAYLAWLDQVDGATRLSNSASLIRWNIDKHYLRHLERVGVPIVPTHYVEPGEACDLEALLERWGALILKPAVSNAANDTIVVETARPELGTAHLERTRERSMMVQPMIRSIHTTGERSQIYFAGELSHVIDKVPGAGDFRVQEHLGGTYRRVEPRPADLDLARKALGALDEVPLYARIDCVDIDGEPRLMEIELIEPDLYLRHAPDGMDRFCEAIERG